MCLLHISHIIVCTHLIPVPSNRTDLSCFSKGDKKWPQTRNQMRNHRSIEFQPKIKPEKRNVHLWGFLSQNFQKLIDAIKKIKKKNWAPPHSKSWPAKRLFFRPLTSRIYIMFLSHTLLQGLQDPNQEEWSFLTVKSEESDPSGWCFLLWPWKKKKNNVFR